MMWNNKNEVRLQSGQCASLKMSYYMGSKSPKHSGTGIVEAIVYIIIL